MNKPVTTQNSISNNYFLLALGLINILAITLLLCGISFLLGLSVAKWQFPLAFVLSLGINYAASGFFGGWGFLKSSGIIIVSVVALTLIAGAIYDVSYDGQWYHQETVYRLKDGYNPAKQTLATPADELNNTDCPIWCNGPDPIAAYVKPAKPIVNLKFLAINYFSKGSEIVEAAIYADTGRIETAKVVNGMLLLATFFLTLSLLYKINKFSVYKKWLLALFIVFNPITVTQWLSFCVDGNVACLILCLLLVCGMIFIDSNKYYLLLFAAIIILVVNLKFTALIFAGIYGITFLVLLLIGKKQVAFKQVLISGALSAVVGIICCGFNPYITNITHKGDVFYGTEAVRTETQQIMPQLFKNHNGVETFLLSISAHQGWHGADSGSLRKVPKIPFTLTKNDILFAKDGQQELSGFGPFFSGIFILSLILLVFLLVKHRKNPVFGYLLTIILVTVFSVLITPYAWWARYVPQFWLVPVTILLLAELVLPPGRRWLTGLLYLSLLLNTGWALLNIVFNISSTTHINYQMRQLQAIHQPVIIKFCMHEPITSNRIRFDEWHIPTTEGDVTGAHVYNVESSTTRFETPVALPGLPESLLMKLGDHLKGSK